ncbi:hypothetical protein MAHJHV60_46860 [Mycobacterium avium subsp. hominissuis]
MLGRWPRAGAKAPAVGSAVPSPRPVASGPAPMPVPGGSELAKASIYLDEHTDAYLETVRAAARTVSR